MTQLSPASTGQPAVPTLPIIHMGNNSNVYGPFSVEQLWRSRSSRNGARCGLEPHEARERGARVREGAVAGRAISVVRKRRNGTLPWAVVPNPIHHAGHSKSAVLMYSN